MNSGAEKTDCEKRRGYKAKRQHETLKYQQKKKRCIAGSSSLTDQGTGQMKTELLCAAAVADEEQMQNLIRSGCDTRAVEGLLEIMRQIVLYNQDAQEENGWNLPHHSASMSNERKMKLMIMTGAHPHLKNQKESYPLQGALREKKNGTYAANILAACALKGIPINWNEMKVKKKTYQDCEISLSGFNAELDRMQRRLLPYSTLSYKEVAQDDISKILPKLSCKTIQQMLSNIFEMKYIGIAFPTYFELIIFKIRWAEERMLLINQCSFLLNKKCLLPKRGVNIIISYLSDQDMRKFITAFEQLA